ncbi:hypothetical protein BGP_2373 [Beggiatoa sp. PS]|nr:hypothetical protein BGP_2373 [Beggiatoa sp. PS]
MINQDKIRLFSNPLYSCTGVLEAEKSADIEKFGQCQRLDNE